MGGGYLLRKMDGESAPNGDASTPVVAAELRSPAVSPSCRQPAHAGTADAAELTAGWKQSFGGKMRG